MDKLVMEEDHMEKLYNSKNPLVKYIHNKRLDEVMKFIPRDKNLRVLDAGCGEGQLLKKIADDRKVVQLYGTDVTKIALENAKKRIPHAKLTLSDLTSLKYQDDFFDIIICTEVIEHITQYKKVLDEFKRVLKKKGLLILTFPNEGLNTFLRLIFLRKPRIPDHVNSFSPRRIIEETDLRLLSHISIPVKNLPSFISIIHLLTFTKN